MPSIYDDTATLEQNTKELRREARQQKKAEDRYQRAVKKNERARIQKEQTEARKLLLESGYNRPVILLNGKPYKVLGIVKRPVHNNYNVKPAPAKFIGVCERCGRMADEGTDFQFLQNNEVKDGWICLDCYKKLTEPNEKSWAFNERTWDRGYYNTQLENELKKRLSKAGIPLTDFIVPDISFNPVSHREGAYQIRVPMRDVDKAYPILYQCFKNIEFEGRTFYCTDEMISQPDWWKMVGNNNLKTRQRRSVPANRNLRSEYASKNLKLRPSRR